MKIMEYRDLKKQYLAHKDEFDTAMQEVCANASFIGGSIVKKLEEELAEYVGVKNCISCANGTDALQLSLMAWGIGSGDAVFVPDFTYFSSGEVVSAVGATPIFVDVNQYTYNIDVDKLEEMIMKAQDEGKYKLKAVIAVDLFGLPADYDRIRTVCEKNKLLLLEDGAQGFGGSIIEDGGMEKRDCSFGDISTTSFFPAKPLGCYGDGGAIFTDNDEWAKLLRSYAVHGKGSSKYDNVRIGMNSRLDTMQAAVLQVKLKLFQYSRGELNNIQLVSEIYDRELKKARAEDKGIILPIIEGRYRSSWAQYTIQLPKTYGQEGRKQLQLFLNERAIPSMIYYIKPMHLQKAFEGTDSAVADCPVTEEICNRVVSLPIDPYKTEAEIVEIVDAVMQFVNNH